MNAPRGVDRAKHEVGVEAAQRAMLERWPWFRDMWTSSCDAAHVGLELPDEPFEAAIRAYMEALE